MHLCTKMCKKNNAFSNLFYLKRPGEFSRVDFKQKPGSPIFPVIPSIFASPGVYIYICIYILVLMCIHRYISVRVSLCVHLDEFKSNGEGVGQFCQKHPSTPRTCSRRFPRHLLWPVVWFTRGSLAVNYQGTLGVLYSPWVIYGKRSKRTFRNEV